MKNQLIKFIATLFIVICSLLSVQGQATLKVGQNTGSISASAVFEAEHTAKGALLPRMSTASVNAIASPAMGLLVYDTTVKCLKQFNGTTWGCIDAAAAANSCAGARISGSGVQNSTLVSTSVPYNTLSTIDYSKGSITTTGNKITIINTGYYVIDALIGIRPTTAGGMQVGILKNGINSGNYQGVECLANVGNNVSVSSTLYLVAGDYIQVCGYSNSPTNWDMLYGNLSVFQVGCATGRDTTVMNPTPATACHTFQVNGASQSLPAATWTILNASGVNINKTSSYNTSTNQFIAKEAGDYIFTGMGNSNAGSAAYTWASLWKNGALAIYGALGENSSTSYGGSAVSGIITLAVGDYVDLRFYNSNTTTALVVNTFNWGGYKIGCGQGRDTTVMPVSQFTACPAFNATGVTSNTNMAAGANVLDMVATSFNIGGNLNTTTDRFVVSKAGIYQFNGVAQFLVTAQDQPTIYVRKNGSQIFYGVRQGNLVSVPLLGLNVSAIDNAIVGDYYELVVNSNGPAGAIQLVANSAQFSGAMLNCTGALKDTITNYIANTCNGASITGATTQSSAITGTYVKYNNLSTVSFTKGSITTSGSQVTIQKAGYYKVSGHMYVVNTSGVTNYLTLILSGVPGGLQSSSLVAGEGAHLNASDIVYLNVGAVISMGIFQNAAGINMGYGELQVFQMDCGGGAKDTVVQQVSQLTACPAFRMTNDGRASNQAGAATQAVDFINTNFDVTNGVNLSIDRFTVTKAGKYSLTGSFEYTGGTAGNSIWCGIRKNGSTVFWGDGSSPVPTGTVTNGYNASIIDNAIVGDYYEMIQFFSAGSTGSIVNNYAYFSGAMLNCAGDSSIASNALEPWYNVATSTPATANTQNIYQMGNVGIGTKTPASKLDVFGTGSTQIKLRGSGQGYTNAILNLIASTDANARGTGMSMSDSISGTQWYSGRPYAGGFTNNDVFVVQRKNAYTLSDDASAYYTGAGVANASNFMTITNNGNVGIGSTTPGTKLYVADNTAGVFAASIVQSNVNASGLAIVASPTAGYSCLNVNGTGTSGGVTIVATSPSTTGTYTASGWAHSSDRRLKKNILPIIGGLSSVLKLNGVSYNYIKGDTEKRHFGFIAQDVQKILPEVIVGTEGDIEKGESLQMVYQNMVPVLVESIKELKAEVDKLKLELELLKKK
jgi:hypothetical protein